MLPHVVGPSGCTERERERERYRARETPGGLDTPSKPGREEKRETEKGKKESRSSGEGPPAHA